MDQESYYIGIKMKADAFIGPEGQPMNYINFDLATARQIRADIDECIAVAQHFATGNGVSG